MSLGSTGLTPGRVIPPGMIGPGPTGLTLVTPGRVIPPGIIGPGSTGLTPGRVVPGSGRVIAFVLVLVPVLNFFNAARKRCLFDSNCLACAKSLSVIVKVRNL